MMIKRLLPAGVIGFISVFILFFFSTCALANISKTPWDSTTSGVPYPQEENRVDVLEEQLIFDLRDSVKEARVTADYNLHNREDSPVDLPVAFALYTSPWTDLESVTVKIEGQEVNARTVWFYELLWPRVQEWVEKHHNFVSTARKIEQLQEDNRAKAAELMDSTLYNELESSGISISREDGTYGEMRDFLASGEFEKPGDVSEVPYNPMEIVRLIAPGETKKAEGAWRSENERGSWPDPLEGGTYSGQFGSRAVLGLVLFNVNLPPQKTKTVKISYWQSPTLDEEKNIAHFQYLLQPAAKWNSFKDLNVQLLLPEDLPAAANLPLERREDTKEVLYSGNFSELPGKNLVLSVKAPKGTFDGGESSYTTIIIIFLVFVLVFLIFIAVVVRLLIKYIKYRKSR